LSICSTSTAKKIECDTVLDACKEHVQALEEEKEVYRRIVLKQDEKITELVNRSEPLAWYWLVLGGVVGGIAISKTIK
jgi:hypothetical protein